MFGRERSILDAFSHYFLDYQERLSNDPEERWTDRVTLDGKWESNLFNFYYRIYGKLVNDLDVPFRLDRDAVRKGETHVHEALREALVDALVHADHLSSRPITILKFKDRFEFSNPGRLRIPIELIYDGGVSDPRNPNLLKMFKMIGLGEQAGSGFPKIFRAWREQQWARQLRSFGETKGDRKTCQREKESFSRYNAKSNFRGVQREIFDPATIRSNSRSH